MKNIGAIVLAGGKGTRMKSKMPKVLHPLCGKPILFYPLELLKELKISTVNCVIGHGSHLIKEAFSAYAFDNVNFVLQEPQLGTGHAVMSALKAGKVGRSGGLKGFSGDILILSGDVPLITKDTIRALVKLKQSRSAAVAFVSAIVKEPGGYGRVVRDVNKNVIRIIEAKDATVTQRRITEVNCGLYLIDAKFLQANINKLGRENAQGEYYLPDLIKIAVAGGRGVSALTLYDPVELMGINNRTELAEAALYMRERINTDHMLSGVTLVDPFTTYIDYGVKIGQDSTIHPGVHLLGDTSIGAGSTVLPNSIVESSVVGRAARIGPFARLRPGNVIKDDVRIGNFVEVKNSSIGKGTKAGHLSYIGDSHIGANVNIGAGVITCNYDGYEKFKTVVRDDVFIGSDSQLIAPVTIGKGAYIGSGSTITANVPARALATSRVKQKVYKDWVLTRNKANKKVMKKARASKSSLNLKKSGK
jgi:bifunctional UDP-N-acetylglucosamine pyrophosphorylase/glucosamine-1-phosphate N-acetyltransferase